MTKKGFFEVIEENIIAVGIIIMVLMETANIVCKFLFPAASGLPEELANFAYIWVAFLCASFCTKRSANIIVDALTNLYPAAVQRVLNALQYVLDLVMSALIIYGGIVFVGRTFSEGAAGQTGIPLWIVYLAPIAGFGLNIVRDIQKLQEAKASNVR